MTSRVKSTDLYRTLEQILNQPILELTRQPWPCSSSFAIERLDVTLRDGRSLQLIFKNLGRSAMLEDAARVKPASLYHPRREINVYRWVHPVLDLGTPKFYGAWGDWLFIEYVSAPELYQIGEFEIWLEAARWLARFHASQACRPSIARALAPGLLEHDYAFYRGWLRRALTFGGSRVEEIEESYQAATEMLLETPRTLIHGEFYASNVLAQRCGQALRICPVDWEMAAIGPCILDVAALASGRWSYTQRMGMAEAWCAALPEALRPPDLTAAFTCAQFQIALQWLGWAESWQPHNDHAHDWLAEAREAKCLLARCRV
jgi:hypothetical protein